MKMNAAAIVNTICPAFEKSPKKVVVSVVMISTYAIIKSRLSFSHANFL